MTGSDRPDGWRRAKPLIWCKAVTRLQLAAGEKLVLVNLALNYASSKDGHGARPGLSHLEHDTGVTRKTVVSALASAESMDILFCAERGSRGRGHASTYDLTLHDELDQYRGPTYREWTAQHRPADSKGVPGHLSELDLKGVPEHLSQPLKGVQANAKRCPEDP